tara:strand:- start:5817 stop:6413 length:597 start_codon:yes stop_codon:yes gene_type:complete
MADIQIINRVYNLLGRDHQDSSVSDEWGQIISDTIDAKLKIMLESNTWSFAIKFKELAQSTSTTNPAFKYQYPLPIDCFKVLEVYNSYTQDGIVSISNPIEHYLYEILGNNLFSDTDSILVKYKVGDISISELPQSFIDSLAYLASSELAINLLENSQLSQMFLFSYEKYKSIARSNDIQNGRGRNFNSNFQNNGSLQ